MFLQSDRSRVQSHKEIWNMLVKKNGLFKQSLNYLFQLFYLFYRVFVADENSGNLQKDIDIVLHYINLSTETFSQFILQTSTIFKQKQHELTQIQINKLTDILDQLSSFQNIPQVNSSVFQDVIVDQTIMNNLKNTSLVLQSVLNRLLDDITKYLQNQIQQQQLQTDRDIMIYCLLQLQQLFNNWTQNFIKNLFNYDIYKFKGSFLSKTIQNEQDQVKPISSIQRILFNKKKIKPYKYVINQNHASFIKSCSHTKQKVCPLILNKIDLQAIRRQITANFYAKGVPIILPYFQPMSKNLYLTNIQGMEQFMSKNTNRIAINVSFVFSQFNKVVLSPKGQIYVLILKNKRSGFDQSFFQYQFDKKSLKSKPPLPVPRRKFSAIYFKEQIMVVGGQFANKQSTKTCLMFDIKKNAWKNIANLSISIKSSSLAVLNDRYVLRLGGVNQFQYIDKSIQNYDFKTNEWNTLKLNLGPKAGDIQYTLYSTAIKISNTQIFVLGEDIYEKDHKTGLIEGNLKRVGALKNNLLCCSGRRAPGLGVAHDGSIILLRVGYY